jgi:type I restriction enzyme M protein
MLFLCHMLSKMKRPEDGGSRVAIVMNGSPLFTGDAGGGESEIRRWIIENDWLEAIVALPEQLFYNTGIATYVWVLTNRKEPHRRGKVQLIDATSFWVPMRRSLGDKRREVSADQIAQVAAIHQAFEQTEQSLIFDGAAFGYRRITVERPLRLNFQASPERVERLKQESVFVALAAPPKPKRSQAQQAFAQMAQEAAHEGQRKQAALLAVLGQLPAGRVFTDRQEFERTLDEACKAGRLKLDAPLRKGVLSALSERDETAALCRNGRGQAEPDTDLRDTERVPLGEHIGDYVEREVLPHVPDAWVDESRRDERDQAVGVVGYEINFNRYFYRYEPPRPLEQIEADIRAVEQDILDLLKEVAG